MSDLKILALSGSLRSASLNSALLLAAADVAPAGVSISLYDYAEVPLFNSDLPTQESVEALKAAIADADAVLIATPEYNYSIPGALKNAIDWASRPAYRSVFQGKPTGVISAAASVVGGARAQQHLKTIMLGVGAPIFPWPELLVGGAHKKFEGGALTDDVTKKFLKDYVEGFAEWIEKQQR